MNQCVILAGGKGSRLGEITKNYPKPMLEINQKPFLISLLDMINRFGFDEVLLLASHANSVLIKYFKDLKYKNCNIKIIIEEVALGTGGAIINAYDLLEDTFYCINGDSIIEGNWLSLNPLLKKKYKAVMALTKVNNSSRYGSVELNNNTVVKFNAKYNNSESNLINGGIYLLRKEIFKNYEKKFISLENDIFPSLIKAEELGGIKINGYFIDIGTLESLEVAKKRTWGEAKKAVIFDRDGTLNIDKGYTHKVEDLKWIDGAKNLIKYLNDLNYFVFVVTNQAGIAKGKYSEDSMHKFHKAMQDSLIKKGAHIDKIYYCPYHIDGIKNEYKKKSNNRKPATGMLENIVSEWNIKKNNMILIGNSDTDIDCANNFNIPGFKYNGLDNLMKFFLKSVKY